MSICFICLQRGWRKTSAGGICVECSSYVCRTPSSRPDNTVHGYPCGCGCRHLVCELDAVVHSQGHGGGVTSLPSPCFPELTLDVAPIAGAAARDIVGGSVAAPGKPFEKIGRLLRTVAPGSMALYNVTAIKGSVLRPETEELRIEQRELSPEFFTQPRVEKIIALAARMTAETVRYTYDVDEPGLTALRDLFGKVWGGMDVRAASRILLGKWVPIGVSVPDPMAVPTEPATLARWLLEDERTRWGLEDLSSATEAPFREFLRAE